MHAKRRQIGWILSPGLAGWLTLGGLMLGVSACHTHGGFPSIGFANRVCAPPGWTAPGAGPLDANELLTRAAAGSVVLLGEQHDDARHHQWQLDTLSRLAALHPDVILGLEMFPRRVQPALDAWVRGELDEAAFLERSEWRTVWRYDPALYMDLFRYARDQGIPMRALNVDGQLTREVGRNGFDATPEALREGISRPAPAPQPYSDWLASIFRMHVPGRAATATDLETQAQHFIEAQLVWDRAMAEGIRDALSERPQALVVALIGSGHLRHGHGVPHQLRDLGVSAQTTFLPWDATANCNDMVAGLADGVYVIQNPPPRKAAL